MAWLCAWLGWLLLVGSVLASGLSGVAGLLGLGAGRGRWGWATEALPEQAGWLALPGAVGLPLAAAARLIAGPRSAALGVLGFAFAAIGLSVWPLALMPRTVGQVQDSLRRVIGPAHPVGQVPDPARRVRPDPFSVRDYVWGVPIAPGAMSASWCTAQSKTPTSS